MNIYKNTNSNKRYYTLDYFYQNKFKSKVFKVSLNAGFTCPNKDGNKGFGGCTYCSLSGSGDYAGDIKTDLITQFNTIKEITHKKWPTSKYIGYFQANTNTYAPVSELKIKYEQILALPKVVGLSIGTRCDAIEDDVLDYLEELNKKTYLAIELGLQTIHESTSQLINRGHDLQCFDNMVLKLHERNIEVVVHIINGLPYETKDMMLNTIRHINTLPINGIKIHMLHILKDTAMAKLYVKEPFPVLTKEQYVDIVCDQLELLKSDIVIHRITGDPVKDDVIEPLWLIKKFGVLNDIDKELARRGTYQGFNASILNRAKQLMINNTKSNDLVIDATVGNGNDTLFLSNIVKNGHVFGFDIQDKAIENTTQLMTLNNNKNYTLFKKSHEFMNLVLADYINKISTIIFNLGYLPNGDKTITTNYKSTIKAIDSAYKLLNDKGLIIVVIYPGHKSGLEESIKLKELNYDINYYYNTDDPSAPYLITIKK